MLGAGLWLALALLASGLAYWLVAEGALTWSSAVAARTRLADAASSHPALAILIYICLFTGAAILLMPVQVWVILLGGILLGFERGVAASMAAALISAGAVFLIGRSTIGEIYRRHARGYLDKIDGAFQKDQFLYMLTLRLVPIFPFCVGNVVPALLGARLAPYLAAAAIGVCPYVLIYSFAGARAAAMLAPHRAPDISHLSGDIILILFALARVPVIAVIIRAQMRRKPSKAGLPS